MSTKKIMIVEGDAEVLSVLALHLRNEEFEVIEMHDGFEALDLARRERPDLILLDVTMSSDETTVLEAYTDYPDLATIPIIYLLPAPKPHSTRGIPHLPEQSSLAKPVVVGELLEKVATLLHEYAAAAPETPRRVA